ncbi:MAG: hypothetical protein ABIH53_02925 [archaeon]
MDKEIKDALWGIAKNIVYGALIAWVIWTIIGDSVGYLHDIAHSLEAISRSLEAICKATPGVIGMC